MLTLVDSHLTLGKIAAKRGQHDEAEGHFSRACAEGVRSNLPTLEFLAGRDWRRHLLEPAGQPTGPADAVMDSACAKMGTRRGRMAALEFAGL